MITLKPLIHDNKLCIAVMGKFPSKAGSIIRNFPGRCYSKTHGCFYFVYDAAILIHLQSKLKEVCTVEAEGWQDIKCSVLWSKYIRSVIAVPRSYDEQLVKMRYSEATRHNYNAQFESFLTYLYPKKAEDITEKEVHDYMLYLVQKKGVSVSTQNQAVNAIKFYLEHVRKEVRKVYYVERPRGECKLPVILSDSEMSDLIIHTKNLKHRCMILLLYSSGLRISELLNLRWVDIDQRRRIIHVRGGKGKKDRITLLSAIAYEQVSKYLEAYRPGIWLFEGPEGNRYSPRSVNKIIKVSAGRAGIVKNISAHTLRHSFATHLLENGTDLRYIQTLLGHESSRTTERYTQVTKKGFEKIESPLDRIARNVILEDNASI